MRPLFILFIFACVLGICVAAPAQQSAPRAGIKPAPASRKAPRAPSTKHPAASNETVIDELQARFDLGKKAEDTSDLIRAESEYRYVLGVSLERLGAVYDQLGDYDKAVDAYRQASEARATAASALLGLGNAYLRKGEYEKGIQAAQTLQDLDPFNVDAKNLLGVLSLAAGKIDQAVLQLETVHIARPDDVEASRLLAYCYLEQRRIDKAAGLFNGIRAKVGDSPRLCLMFGLAYRQYQYSAQAVAEFRRAVALDPAYPRAHYFLGLALLWQDEGERLRDMPQAVAQFEEELKRHPDDALATYMLGLVYTDVRRYTDAVPLLQKAAGLDPTRPELYIYLGQALYLSGRHEEAVPPLEKAIALTKDPGYNAYQIWKAHYWLGQYLTRSGKTAEAKKQFDLANDYKAKGVDADKAKIGKYMGGMSGPDELRRIVESTEEHKLQFAPPAALAPGEKAPLERAQQVFAGIAAQAYNALGLLKARQSEFGRASRFLGLAARLNPALPDIDYNLGLARFKADEYAGAVAALETAHAREPERMPVTFLLGLGYFFNEQYKEAGPLLTAAARGGYDKDPQLIYALGLCHAYAGDRALGRKILASLVERQPDSPDAHIAMGRAMALDNDIAPALEEFGKALALDAKVADAHYYRGLALIRLSKNADAIEEFRQELSVNPRNARAAYHLGFCLSSLDRVDEALAALADAVRLDPRYANAHYERGKILVRQRKFDDAIGALKTAIDLGAERSYAYYQLAQAYQRSGKGDQAQAALVKYQELKAKEEAARPPVRTIEPEQK